MIDRIKTQSGKRVGYLAWDLSDGETGPVAVLQIIPADGFYLTADEDDDVVIEARETGSGDPWTPIGASPYDLSSFDPEDPVLFDVRARVPGALTDVRRVRLGLRVSNVI